MQLRDDKKGILLPGHWASFGGSIDPGEDAATAMRRELVEELELKAREVAAFTEMTVVLPLDPPRLDRMSFFVVPVDADEIAAMVQHEGAGKRLFTPTALAREKRVRALGSRRGADARAERRLVRGRLSRAAARCGAGAIRSMDGTQRGSRVSTVVVQRFCNSPADVRAIP